MILSNIQKIEYWDIVSEYLDENESITNTEARNITGINDTLKMSRLLKIWVDNGLLEKIGKGRKDIFYIKSGHFLSEFLFS